MSWSQELLLRPLKFKTTQTYSITSEGQCTKEAGHITWLWDAILSNYCTQPWFGYNWSQKFLKKNYFIKTIKIQTHFFQTNDYSHFRFSLRPGKYTSLVPEHPVY